MSAPWAVADLIDEQVEKWTAGDRVPVERLLDQHAVTDDEACMDLIYSELLLREERGEQPQAQEYLDRFPNLTAQISRQFQVHRGIAQVRAPTIVAGSTLDPDQPPKVRDVDPLEVPGFELLDLVGRGGSGVCYRARDLSLNRTVAIKLLSDTRATDEDLRKQLLKEAEAAASLVHSSIVRVHQIGQSLAGTPYLVMEYVEGGSLAEQLKTTSPIAPRKAAQLALDVTEAIRHAHEHGVIHRDLKPGNILLDDDSQPHVCDFGLARKLDPTETRNTTNIVGTPAYMPPEQARGEPTDARSDVYSLGATLYEMLGGRSPFHGVSAWDTLYQVMTSEPLSVRKLNSAVPVDLETICAKCLEKRPENRYASAADLASDLRLFLENRPIKSRPVSSFERFRRWCARNRALSATLSVAALLAISLLVGSIVAAVRFRDQNVRLANTLETSIEAADELLVSVTEDAELLPKTTGSQEISRKLLRRAQQYYQTFLAQNADQPQLRSQLARTHAGLAMVAYRLDDLDTVEKETKAALQLLDELEAEQGRSLPTTLLRARVLEVNGATLQSAMRSTEAVPVLEKSCDLCKQAYESDPENIELLEVYGKAQGDLANCHQTLGDNEKSIELLTEASKKYARLVELEPDALVHVLTAARIQHNLGNSKRHAGFDAMSIHYKQSIAMLKALPSDDRKTVRVRYQLATSSMNLGIAYSRLGNLKDADDVYSYAIQELGRLVELEPDVGRHKQVYAMAVMNSGSVDNQLQNFDRLAERVESVMPIVDRLVVDEPDNLAAQELKAMLSDNQALALRELGKTAEAIESHLIAEVAFRNLAKANDWPPDSLYPLALNQYLQAQCLLEADQFEPAREAVVESRQTTVQGLKKEPAHVDLRLHMLDLVILETETLDPTNPEQQAEIRKLVEDGHTLVTAMREDIDNVTVLYSTANLFLIQAMVLFEQKEFADAQEQAIRAIASLESDLEEPYALEVQEILGEAHIRIAMCVRERHRAGESSDELADLYKQSIQSAKSLGVNQEMPDELRD